MTHFLNSNTAITNPGNFIASIPGVLGYYPQESVIIVTAYAEPGNPYALYGPVFRVDLSLAHHLQRELDSVAPEEGLDAVGHFAILVTRIPNSGTARAAVETILKLQDSEGHPLVDACWHTSEIANFTPYNLVFGPPITELVKAGVPDSWVAGTVGSVLTQPTMQPLIAQGALPELDRADTRAYFDPIRGQGEATNAESTALAQRGSHLAARITTHPNEVRLQMERACEILQAVKPLPLVGQTTYKSLEDVFGSADNAALIAAALTRSKLRDCLFNVALEHPLSTATAMLTLARTYPGVIRANALSLWAVIAVKLQLPNWATAALECAEDAMPNHSLSCILRQLLRAGQHASLLTTASIGCDEMWQDLEGV